jgi:hypothetical protein
MFSASDLKDLDLKDLKKSLNSNLKDLRKLDKDDLLELIGLETKRDTADWLLPTLGALSVGVLLGAGVGLLIAQKPGSELRGDLRKRLQKGEEAVANGIAQARSEISSRGT